MQDSDDTQKNIAPQDTVHAEDQVNIQIDKVEAEINEADVDAEMNQILEEMPADEAPEYREPLKSNIPPPSLDEVQAQESDAAEASEPAPKQVPAEQISPAVEAPPSGYDKSRGVRPPANKLHEQHLRREGK